MTRTGGFLVVLLSSLIACSDRGGSAGAQTGRGRIEDSSAGTVALGIVAARGYRPNGAGGNGAVAGRIVVGRATKDSMVAVTRDARVCGDSVRASGGTGAVLVWIEGLTTGKPLPEVRRETLNIEHCQFEPRILAVA